MNKAATKIKVGISACLMGQEVRYDGGHKRSRYVTDVLAEYFTLMPVCPEVEVGMPVPRETIRLVGTPENPHVVAPGSGTDWTIPMTTWSRKRTRELADEDLSGFIFKKNSPSCGVFRVKVYGEKGAPNPKGRGLFATAFTSAYPLVPVEEEGRLGDARLRENFIERVFAYHRLKALFTGRWKRGAVVDFHSREKYLLMAHSPRHYKELGQWVAAIAEHKPTEFRDRYCILYMECLGTLATARRHVNALQHVAGHLRELIDPEEQRRILACIHDFGAGLVPLVVPMTLLKHYIEIHRVPYVQDQSYLNPHPRELMLRNHV